MRIMVQTIEGTVTEGTLGVIGSFLTQLDVTIEVNPAFYTNPNKTSFNPIDINSHCSLPRYF